MILDSSSSLRLRSVTTTESDIDELFQLLCQRQFGISHAVMPSFGQHRDFVLSHPYRAWYFVQENDVIVGSLYLLKSNHIGINMRSGYARCIESALALLRELYQPLPPIASVRSASFVVNVAPGDSEQVDALEQAGALLIQRTYQLP